MTRLTVAYLHGAGVRAVDAARAVIEEGLAKAGLTADVAAVEWGQAAGAPFPDIEPFIPPPSGREAVDLPALRRELRALSATVGGAVADDPPPSASNGGDGEAATAAVSLLDRVICRLIGLPDPAAAEATLFAPASGAFDLSRRLTRALQACRADLMQPWVPPIADVLHYQRHGADARAYVAAALDGIEPPCLVLSESYGATIAVDVLTAGAHDGVGGFVSVGAQVAVIYEMHALETLIPGTGRAPFLPWLNIYNPYDFASFLAAPAWPDLGIRDTAVDDGRTGFPQSHVSYFSNPATFEAIAAAAREWGLVGA